MSVYEPAPIHDEKQEVQLKPKPQFCSLYMITHMIISFFAIYLSWRCNKGFNLLSFLAALLCPYLYIIWVLATRGGCGLFNAASSTATATLTPTSLSPLKPMTF
jgi:hypothetical protein